MNESSNLYSVQQSKHTSPHLVEQSASDWIYEQLADKFGVLIGGHALRRLLDFETDAAMNKAVARGSLHLPLFHLPGRPGFFILTRDLANWISAARANSVLQ